MVVKLLCSVPRCGIRRNEKSQSHSAGCQTNNVLGEKRQIAAEVVLQSSQYKTRKEIVMDEKRENQEKDATVTKWKTPHCPECKNADKTKCGGILTETPQPEKEEVKNV